MHACLNERTAHMINCVIADHILTDAQMPPPTTHAPKCQQGYAFMAHILHIKQLHSAANASEHFIGAFIDNTTGDVLEKPESHQIKQIQKGVATQLCKQIRTTVSGNTQHTRYRHLFFSFAKRKSPNTNPPHAATLSAMSGHKRMRSIALYS